GREARGVAADDDVADREQDRAGEQENRGVPGGEPQANRRSHHGIRYPEPVTVSISGGSPSLRRSRARVTRTVLSNGSNRSSQRRRRRTSVLSTRPSARRSVSSRSNSRGGSLTGRPALLPERRPGSSARTPRSSMGGAGLGFRRARARRRAPSSSSTTGFTR